MQNYLTREQVGKKLGNRSRTAIYLDIELGRLPKPVKIGGRIYWAEDDLEKFIQDQIKEEAK